MASAMFKKKYQRHKRSYGEAGVSLASDAEALLEEGDWTPPGPPHHALSLSKEERKRKWWRWCNLRAACRSDRSMKYVLVFMSIFSLTSMLLSFKVVGTLHGQVKNSPLRMEEGQCKPVPAERLDGLAYICNGKGCQIDLLCFSMSLMRLQSKYEGRIYVVTDRDDLFEGKACGNNAPEYEAIPFQNSSSTTRMHMKLTRAKLFDMIPDRNAKSLIYIDADILPVGCLHDFLAAEDPSSIGLFLDSWCPDCNTYLTALMYMKKTDKTSACLSEWSKEALREGGTAYHKDQDALDTVLTWKHSSCRAAIQTMSNAYIETFDDKMILPLFGVITGNAPVFQHFTHGIRSLPIWRRIERQIHAQLVGKISYLKELELSKRKGSGDGG